MTDLEMLAIVRQACTDVVDHGQRKMAIAELSRDDIERAEAKGFASGGSAVWLQVHTAYQRLKDAA